jgi:hypothetical protein
MLLTAVVSPHVLSMAIESKSHRRAAEVAEKNLHSLHPLRLCGKAFEFACILLNPDFPLGFVMMADAFFEPVLLRMRRQ